MAKNRAMLIRVSSGDQNTDRQMEVAKELGIPEKNIFEEKISGATPIAKRDVLQELIRWCRNEDDEIYFASIDRAARSLVELEKLVTAITDTGASVTFVKEKLTFSNHDNSTTATSKLLFQILGSFAQFEREMIRERQRQGIEVAKSKGVYKERCGRKRVDPLKFKQIDQLVADGMPITKACLTVGISRAVYYKHSAEIKCNS